MKTSWRHSQNLLPIYRDCLGNPVNSHIPLGHENSISPFTAFDRLRKMPPINVLQQPFRPISRLIFPTSAISFTINLNSHNSKAICTITTNEGF